MGQALRMSYLLRGSVSYSELMSMPIPQLDAMWSEILVMCKEISS